MKITEETTIAEAIALKGRGAGTIIDEILCNGEKVCCPGTTHKIGFAAGLKKQQKALPDLLKKLNNLPDIR